MNRKWLKTALCIMLCAVLAASLVPATSARAAAADVQTTLTTERTAYANGEYVSFSCKYVLDYGKVQSGDTITITVPDVLKNVSVAYSTLHFSACNDLGNGTYQLVFNDSAPEGLTGYFSINAFANNTTTTNQSGTVAVGDKTVDITVSPTPTGGEPGVETRAIEKWAPDGTNYTQDTAISGVYSEGAVVRFAFEVDPRLSSMKNVIVTDSLPDELVFVPGSIVIERTSADKSSTTTLTDEEAAAFITSSGQDLQFNFGDMDGTYYYRVYYKASVVSGTNVSITNSAYINYDNGTVETSAFTLKAASGAGAAVGYKKVDKTQITDDPADQIVTYTINFSNDNAFAKNEINLKDKLDSRLTLVTAYGSTYFDVSYDKTTNTVSITNNKEIPASMKQTVTIVVDFSNVPVGTTISNTVGGNTVKTEKVHEGALVVSKTVTGAGADYTKSFDFTVTLSDKTINGTYGNMVFTNGVATFSLKNGESKKAVKLPEGTQYTVTEADYSSDHYSTLKSGDTGTLSSTTDSLASFTNTYKAPSAPTPPVKDVFKSGDLVNSVDGQQVKIGDTLVYTVKYTNTTGSDVIVSITDNLPENCAFVSADNGGTQSGVTVTWSGLSVKDGGSVTVSFKVTVGSDGTELDNQAFVAVGDNNYQTNITKNPVQPAPVTPTPAVGNVTPSPSPSPAATPAPSAAADTGTPKTGDNSNAGLWAVLMFAAVGAAAIVCTEHKRRGTK